MCRILSCCLLVSVSVCGRSAGGARTHHDRNTARRNGRPRSGWVNFRNQPFERFSSRRTIAAAVCRVVRTGSPIRTALGRSPFPISRRCLEAPNDQGMGRYLICDVTGAGAIVRTWSAAIEGTLRVHLDDADEPLFEGPAQEFLQQGLQSLLVEHGLTEAEYLGSYRQRDACYFPIPFCQSLPDRMDRRPAEDPLLRGSSPAIRSRHAGRWPEEEQMCRSTCPQPGAWRKCCKIRCDTGPTDPRDAVPVDVRIPGGNIAEGPTLEGPQAIERLTLKVAAENLDLALRQTDSADAVRRPRQQPGPVSRRRFLRSGTRDQPLQCRALYGRAGRNHDVSLRHAVRQEVPHPV